MLHCTCPSLFYLAEKESERKGERGNGPEVAGVQVSNAECTEVNCWRKQRRSIWQWWRGGGGGHLESMEELLICSLTPCLERHTERHVREHTNGNTHPLVTCRCWSLLHAGQSTQSDVFRLCLPMQSFVIGHKHTLELMSWAGRKPQFNTARSWLFFRESPKHFNLPLPELKLSAHTDQRRLETQPYCTHRALLGHCVDFYFIFFLILRWGRQWRWQRCKFHFLMSAGRFQVPRLSVLLSKDSLEKVRCFVSSDGEFRDFQPLFLRLSGFIYSAKQQAIIRIYCPAGLLYWLLNRATEWKVYIRYVSDVYDCLPLMMHLVQSINPTEDLHSLCCVTFEKPLTWMILDPFIEGKKLW